MSVADATAAEAGGADRIELVADLARGGMTPSLDVIDAVLAAVTIPVRVMVRATESHEILDAGVRRQLLRDAEAVASRPVDGLVCGFLRDGMPDLDLTAEMAAAANGVALTFHRAFDEALDQDAALSQLARAHAVDKVLTSGGAGEWAARRARLERWCGVGRPTMLFGGGLTLDTLDAVAGVNGIREVHIGRAARAGGSVTGTVDAERVAAVVSALTDLARSR